MAAPPSDPTSFARRPLFGTDPVAPAVLLVAAVIVGLVRGPPFPLLWAAMGGVAGFSLSGSV